MKPLTVSDAFKKNLARPDKYPTDSKIEIVCPVCTLKQLLSDTNVTTEGSDTLYRCGQCDDLFIVVCAWPSKKWQGRGYRLGDLCIHNKGELYVPVVGSPGGLVFPARDDACIPTIG